MNAPSNSHPSTERSIWAVASGKGGVGKSLVSANFAICLACLRESVIAIDLDLGNTNLHSYLGIKYPLRTLANFFAGDVSDINEIAYDTPIYNLKLIPGAGGILGTSNPAHAQKLKLIRYIEHLQAENILLDLSAGSSYNTIDFYLSANSHILVVTPEPTSIQSSYNFLRICLFRKLNLIFANTSAALETIDREKNPAVGGEIFKMETLLGRLEKIDPYGVAEFRSFQRRFRPHVVFNMIMKNQEVKYGYGFCDVVKKFLDIPARFAGSLPYETGIRDSLSAGIPHVIYTPRSPFSQSLMTLSETLLDGSIHKSLVQETLKREIPRFGRSYQQRIVEPVRRNVDPSVDAAIRVQDAAVMEKTDSRPSWSFAANSWSKIAIDLGTTYTRIFVNGRGIILNEPSLICLEENTGKIVALGLEAKSMTGRAHSGINVLSPLESSAITDYTDVKRMVMEFMRQAKRSTILIRPGVLLTIQPGLTSLEKRAFLDFIKELGAREVHLVYQPLAAAIGAGLPVDVPRASMVVNIGGGSITAIVISLSGIVAMASDKVGGKQIDNHIIRYLRENHNFCIGEQTAEWIKINYGQAMKVGRDSKIDIRGQDIIMGVPDTLSISTAEIREAISKPITKMLNVIRDLLERVPPELSADLVDRGMTLTGGGSLLTGLDRLITEKTGLTAKIAPNALTATIEGAGRMLADFNSFSRFFVQDFAVQDK